ncbi:hypothetical protein [Streptomyces fuscigenes]|uniref:hypothetical protein n=1 Tax=Streptomyces fuscigenes TaxID=1528880 RepID=UPI001F3565A3|nr:hypothetical protein [Streptomyces fuscigenes]MCF3965525.1 hypothetical protein [Streptomyces fuscigenes]
MNAVHDRSDVEDRLRAALSAKAATVTRTHLRRPEPPSGARRGNRLRTTALLTLAAALIGAALVLPAALSHHTEQPPATSPHSPTVPPPSPQPAPARPSPSSPVARTAGAGRAGEGGTSGAAGVHARPDRGTAAGPAG